MHGLATAATIVACNSAATALLVYGLFCPCPWGTNVCWIAALALLYAPAIAAARGVRHG
jgi:hypothetical protein